jgi:hypothetical protein
LKFARAILCDLLSSYRQDDVPMRSALWAIARTDTTSA